MTKRKETIDADTVLAYLEDHAGRKYQAANLASKFCVGVHAMHMILTELKPFIVKEREGAYDVVYVKSYAPVTIHPSNNKLNAKIWQMPQATKDSLARAREGRTEDFSFINLTSNVVEVYKS